MKPRKETKMTFDLLKVLLDTEALRRSSPTHGQEQV